MPKCKYTKEILEPIVKSSNTFKEVCEKLGRSTRTSQQSYFSMLCSKYEISYSHFRFFTGEYLIGLSRSKKDLASLLKINTDKIYRLKDKLIQEGYKEAKCEKCGLTEWLGGPPTLDVDHINDDPKDNRLSNLQILCCNCHRVKTLESRKWRKESRKSRNCICLFCGGRTHRSTTTRCKRCYLSRISAGDIPSPVRRKFNPTKEELFSKVWEMPTTAVAKYYGVSDKAIEKRCNKFGISKPPRGYWAKRKYGKM